MKIHKEMYYFETKEVRPSRDDADKAYEILAWNGYYWARVYYKNLHIDPIDNEDPAEFYTPVQSEEYVIDYKLTKEDCIERMYEEKQDSKNEGYAQMYKDSVERYKAIAMEGKIVEASFKCVVDEY